MFFCLKTAFFKQKYLQKKGFGIQNSGKRIRLCSNPKKIPTKLNLGRVLKTFVDKWNLNGYS